MRKFNEIITEQFRFSSGILKSLSDAGLGIYEITETSWLTNYKLPDESSLKEIRIKLGKIYSQEEFNDDWGNYLDNDEYSDEVESDRNQIGEVLSDRYDNFEFSVFLDKGVKIQDKKSKKYDLFVALCLTQASAYLKLLLLSIPEVFNNLPWEYKTGWDHTEGLGKFCTFHNLKITNSTLESAVDAVYRLYKDSKFFHELKGKIGDTKYENLVNDVIKVIK
jgi:hypothetical protein